MISGDITDSLDVADKKLGLKGHIKMTDVYFSYPTRTDVPVLKGINLEAQAGEKIALVGSCGAGKSTIVQLILRFSNIELGQITIDDKNINKLPLSSYRLHMAIVLQRSCYLAAPSEKTSSMVIQTPKSQQLLMQQSNPIRGTSSSPSRRV